MSGNPRIVQPIPNSDRTLSVGQPLFTALLVEHALPRNVTMEMIFVLSQAVDTCVLKLLI